MRNVFKTPEAEASAENSRYLAIQTIATELAVAAHLGEVDLGDERSVAAALEGRWAPSAIRAYQEPATEVARSKLPQIRAGSIGIAAVAVALGATIFPIDGGIAS